MWRQRQRESATAPGKTSNGSTTSGKKGGKLEQLGASDVDFLDPGQTYYTGGFQVIYATQTPLYAPKPDQDEAEPALADGQPQISDDKKSVTVKLKKGVKFGPPVNREIQAKDVKYAFERAATKNVPNQYTTYFNFIEGYPKKPGALQDIPGIVVDNPYQITFKLAKAQGPGFAAFADHAGHARRSRRSTPRSTTRQSPSTYNEHVVASGPYMVENDASGQAHRLQGRQVDPPRPQPELEQGPGLPSRVPRRDQRWSRTRPTPTSPAARCSRART